MEKRFELIEEVGVRNITGYNEATKNDPDKPYMPRMVIIIDEFADLMMTAKDEVETAVVRIAQKARAAGIHLIVGTQRPSVDVITGLIKANIPSRIAFTVMSGVDSRTILDTVGAEKLCGRGDMLYAPVGAQKPQRVQGAFVSDEEVEAVVTYVKEKNAPVRYDREFEASIDNEAAKCGNAPEKSGESFGGGASGGDEDSKLWDAVELAIDAGKISTSLLQRRLEVGYGRAAKIIDRMEEMGFVSAPDGNKPRKILITKEELEERRLSEE
jgi:S-DNA-T family DNA segregation ATPase FtsK/SpoIIIE